MAAYSVEASHFYELIYSEGDHSMKVEIDLRDPVPCLYKKVLKAWEPPHDTELISDAKREEILERVYDYLTQVKKYRKVEIERGA